jgi:iron complex outermembrane recepter protein
MIRNSRQKAVFSTVAIAMSAYSLPSHSAAPATPSTTSNGNETLEEVIVTAQRRATDVLGTALSIAVTSGEELSANQQNTVADLQATTPNLQVNTLGLYNSVNIRGIGNSNIAPQIQPGVAVFLDGLLSAETLFIGSPFFDIGDVEVLRGPQGTLVSAASTGGSVQINSRNPDFNGIGGYVEGQLGNYSEQRVNGAVNLPISDTWAMRVAFNAERRGSFYRDLGSQLTPQPSKSLNDPGQVQDTNFRVGMLYKPSERFNALLKVEADYSDPGGTAAQPNPATFHVAPGQSCPNPNDGAGPLCHSPFYQYGTKVPFLLNYDVTNLFNKQRAVRAGLDLHYTLDSGLVIRSLTGYSTLDARLSEDDDASSAVAVPTDYQEIGPGDKYVSEDVTLQSPDSGKVTWIVGAEMFYRNTPVHVSTTSFPNFPGPGPTQLVQLYVPLPGNTLDNGGSTNRNQGLFGNFDWNITDKLQFDLGLRGNWDENFSRGYVNVRINGNTVANVPPAADYTANTVTGKVGFNWKPSATDFLYAFFARGYKPGGAQSGGQFQMEHVNDFELGWKGRLLDDHLRLQVGGYYTDYQSMQIQGYSTTRGAAAIQNLIGGTRIYGVEFSGQGRVGELGVHLDLAYLHSSLGEAPALVESFALPLSAANKAQCASGQSTGCFDYTPYQVTVSGEQNAYSPPFTASLGLDYAFHVASGELRPGVRYSHTDKQYAGLFQADSFLELGTRDLVSLTVTYETKDWTTEAYCNNCSSVTYASGLGFLHGGGTAGQDIFYGAPRQIGVRFRRNF